MKNVDATSHTIGYSIVLFLAKRNHDVKQVRSLDASITS